MGRIAGFFQKYPLVANAAVYGTMFVTAEFSQQTFLRKISVPDKSQRQPYDTKALVNYAIVGYGIAPQIGFRWYRWLDNNYVGTAKKIIAKKVFLDQFLFTPVTTFVFYSSMGVLEQKENFLEEFKQKFLPTFAANCIFWLPMQTINFLMVPPVARFAFVGVCAFCWLNILCWLKRQPMETNEPEAAETN